MHKDISGKGEKIQGAMEFSEEELSALEKELGAPLRRYGARPPLAADTDHLIASLQPEFDLLREERADSGVSLHQLPLLQKPSLLRYWGRLAGTLGKSFWIANVAVFAMLTLVSKVQSPAQTGSLFAFLLPLFMMVSIGYGYRTWNRQMRDVETITPFPPALQMLSRLVLAVGINLAFGLVSSVYLDVSVSGFAALPFLLEWLSELVLVGGVLAVVLFHKGTKAGFAVAAAAWFLCQTPWWPGQWGYLMLENRHALYAVQGMMLSLGLLLFAAAYRKCLRIKWVDA